MPGQNGWFVVSPNLICVITTILLGNVLEGNPPLIIPGGAHIDDCGTWSRHLDTLCGSTTFHN